MDRPEINERLNREINLQEPCLKDDGSVIMEKMLYFNLIAGFVNSAAHEIYYSNGNEYPKDFPDGLIYLAANAFIIIKHTDTAMPEREEIFDRIYKERERQESLYGGAEHTIPEWMLILNEEIGEANKSANQFHFDGVGFESLADELIQVVAVAIRILDNVK